MMHMNTEYIYIIMYTVLWSKMAKQCNDALYW